ncbi:MAG: hypothetical protein RB292_04000 [Patescibacteria group bacterium]|jgi:hypothetical protein|nr:hypothetical protein [Patescibacteria group bacterium]
MSKKLKVRVNEPEEDEDQFFQARFAVEERAIFSYIKGNSDEELEPYDGAEVTIVYIDTEDSDGKPYGIKIEGLHEAGDPEDFSMVSDEELEEI